ncbi:Twin-arginine translocation pathway signal sequence domain protein precursor [Flavobacterium frigidimaris]|uniref:Twin-arginine translocation pathway signal sequence domain protein n=2 Tax=Flavobacterium frigidimaris TaxID=262320 RepID=A0ABX4BVW2_FLAFR|nr:Twin-arginine translocation pathway signal sequence domain protein precursor [Flavobacterium frigidimaris]
MAGISISLKIEIMNRRNFLTLTGTFTGGLLVLPDFLHAFGSQTNLITGEQCIVFVQLNGGNDGLNTFIPYDNPLYYDLRTKIALNKDVVVGKNKGMAFHPSLKDFAQMQQNGDLTVIQNVGYPEPIRSHFRSQEIWQTATDSDKYINEGWLGRYLDLQCNGHQATAGINLDSIDNLALKGTEPNSITVKDPNRFKVKSDKDENVTLSDNPQLDFVRKIANSVTEGSDEIQKALAKSKTEISYPKTGLSKNLEWIARLIKGNLNSKVYYTSLGGFDTHDNQLAIHEKRLTDLNDALFTFYQDLKQAQLMQNVTVVVFSEFGRRVKDNGNGTDHGTAAPMFIIGGNNKGTILGNNPNLSDLDNGDLKHEIDFRSVYASLLKEKMNFDYSKIGIRNKPVSGLFS